MLYDNFKNVKLPVSKIVLGTSTDSCFKGNNCDELFDAALKEGITTFDTARVYGKSEEVLGDWMEKRNNRNKVVILSKGGHHSPLLKIKRLKAKDILYDFNTSCQKLKTDYIDIYLLHRDNPAVPVDEMVETLNGLYAKGKIGAFGGSNWSHNRIEQANEYAYKHNLEPFTFSSPYFGLADMKKTNLGHGMIGITGNENHDAREWYKENQMPIIAYSSLGRGLFSGKIESAKQLKPLWTKVAFGDEKNFERLNRCKALAEKKGCTVAQLAIAWAVKSQMNVFAIVGASKIGTIKSSVQALEVQICDEEYKYLNLE